MDLMGARWYAPSAGDFTSADTVQVNPDPAGSLHFDWKPSSPCGAPIVTGREW